MKVQAVWEWEQAKEIHKNWRDGLRAATEILGIEWKLDETPDKDCDWIITWCDSNSQFSRNKSAYKAKRGIFLTTHPHNYENLKGFDVVFCETSIIYEECRMRGIRAVRAFGTDDNFYKPHQSITKDIEYFYPATFSPWKKHDMIAHLGDKLTCIGTIQPDGQHEYDACIKAGVNVEVGYFPPEKILNYYQRAKNVIIPAVHGSERTVLEAMSCGILPEVINPKNIRARSYLKEMGKLKPREFIKKNYSAQGYADSIMKGINES